MAKSASKRNGIWHQWQISMAIKSAATSRRKIVMASANRENGINNGVIIISNRRNGGIKGVMA
jgi:hypothetical protein